MPIIQLKKVEDVTTRSAMQHNTTRHESSASVSEFNVLVSKQKPTEAKKVERSASVPEIFKQRLVTHRRNLSKKMVF